MRYTAFGTVEKISTPGKNADQNWTKAKVNHKALSEGRERSFYIFSMGLIETDIDFHQQWG